MCVCEIGNGPHFWLRLELGSVINRLLAFFRADFGVGSGMDMLPLCVCIYNINTAFKAMSPMLHVTPMPAKRLCLGEACYTTDKKKIKKRNQTKQ